jgi:hypothetical protein
MKVVQIGRTRYTDHGQMRAAVENYEKHGAPRGLETLWMSVDGRTMVAIYEVDDLAEMQKFMYVYDPYFEQLEVHVVTDVSVGIPAMKEALDMVL